MISYLHRPCRDGMASYIIPEVAQSMQLAPSEEAEEAEVAKTNERLWHNMNGVMNQSIDDQTEDCRNMKMRHRVLFWYW
jgi:hypothetical protein